MKYSILILIVFVISCSDAPAPSGTALDLTGYEQFKVNGTSTEYAVRKANNGAMLAEGMVVSGVQNGIWMTYFPDNNNKIKTIANYVNGNMNGPYLELNDRGQIEKKINYLNSQIHGTYAEFKFGRPLKEYQYDEGVLDGLSKEYNNRGKLIKETNYKKGKLHGIIKQYDDDGNVILEYEYKNGEKISGGIVPKSESTTE